MAIPSTQDLGFDGAEWWNPANGTLPSPWQRAHNALKSGNMCHFVASDGSHNVVQIGAINTDGGVTQISVQSVVGGRVTTLCNIPYDATGATHYSFHLPADG